MNRAETYEECLRDCIERSRFGAIVIPCWLAEDIATWIENHRENEEKEENNQEAIDILTGRYLVPVEDGADEYAERVNKALDLAIDALNHQSVFEQVKWERDVALQTLEEHGIGLGQKSDWIPVSKGYPKDLEEVNVTYVNRNPPVYYEHERDKPHTAAAVFYQGMWYWWSSTITDILAEYGDRSGVEPIDRYISITAWKPLPKPYKESDSE